jgi:hypothetical protein
MNSHAHSVIAASIAAALSFATLSSNALAQTGRVEPVQVGAGATTAALPPPRSDNDAQPQVSAPLLPAGGIVQQGGVGGTTAYGRAGVLELGGHIGLNINTAQTALTIAPTIGWFFADNFQISGIVGYRYTNTTVNGTDIDAHSLQLLVEPSVHIPFSRTLFGFVGLGLGLSYVTGPGAGFALAQRLGVNLLVGRSGVLTPALQFGYSTNDTVQTTQGTLLAVSATYGLNIGYTVMW